MVLLWFKRYVLIVNFNFCYYNYANTMMLSNIINVFQCSAFIAFSFKSYFKLLNVIPRLLYYHIIFFFLTTWKISNRILTISSFISIDEIIFLDDYQISEEFLSQCSSKTVILVWISLKRLKKIFFWELLNAVRSDCSVEAIYL